MNTSIRFSEADRDERGFVKVPPATEPRSLADLLPTPQSIQANAQQRPASRAEQALLLIVALIVIAIAAWRFGVGGEVAPQSRPAAPAATQTRGDVTLTPSPPPAVLLPAYSAPDVPLGPIESTRAITPTAHFGDDWIQAIVSGSGKVWLRAADWPSLAIVGPDLAPRPTPIPAAAPAAPFVPEATPPPPPPPCARAGVAGKMVEVCDYAELSALEAQAKAKWIEQYGGNVGIVGTPSPQIMRTP